MMNDERGDELKPRDGHHGLSVLEKLGAAFPGIATVFIPGKAAPSRLSIASPWWPSLGLGGFRIHECTTPLPRRCACLFFASYCNRVAFASSCRAGVEFSARADDTTGLADFLSLSLP